MNLLWCVVDCDRYDAHTENGYKKDTTPNISAITSEDFVKFSRAYSQSTFTFSSSSSMLTGTYPSAHGALTHNDRLPSNIKKAADYLEPRSFEAFSGMNWFTDEWGLAESFSRVHDMNQYHGGKPRADQIVTEFKNKFDSLSRPFGAMLWFFDLHTPYETPPSFQDDNPHRACYDSELAFVDEQIGVLINFLKSQGEYEETMIIITSDHGELFDEHHKYEGNRLIEAVIEQDIPYFADRLKTPKTDDAKPGFLGHNPYPLYEELIHVPLYVKFPHGQWGGQTVDALVELVDILPTIVDTLSINIPASGRDWQGQSLVPILENEERGHEYVFSEVDRRDHSRFTSIHDGEFKLVTMQPTSLAFPILRNYFSEYLIEKWILPRQKLYKIDFEKDNIIDDYQSMARKLNSKSNAQLRQNFNLNAAFENEQVRPSEETMKELSYLGYR